MIYCLTGTLLEKSLDNVVIDVQGVGFSLAVPSTVQGVLPAVGEKCTLYTYLSVKERSSMTTWGTFPGQSSKEL